MLNLYTLSCCSDDDNKVPEAVATRAESCAIQEHFEEILRGIFHAAPPSHGLIDELKNLLVTATLQTTNNLMQTLGEALANGIDIETIGKIVFAGLRLYRPNLIPPLTPNDVIALLTPATPVTAPAVPSSSAAPPPLSSRLSIEQVLNPPANEQSAEAVSEDNL